MSDQVGEMSQAYHADVAGSVVPEGYKQTEVGVIPEDWTVDRVGAIFQMQLGKMLDENKNTGTTKLMIGNRGVQWGRIDTAALSAVRLSQAELSRFRLESGDVLVCEGGDVGRCAIWMGEVEECYFQKALHRLRPKADYNLFLFVNYLKWLSEKGGLKNYVTQTSIAHLPKDKFELVPVIIPSNKKEQTAIANALSDVDALISEQEKLIAKKQAIKTATMQQLLTGRTRLPPFALREDGSQKGYKQSELGEVPEDWDVKRLREISPSQSVGLVINPSSYYSDRGTVPMLVGSHVFENEIRWGRANKITQQSNSLLPASRLNEGDLVTVRVGEPGVTAVIPSELDQANCASMMIVRKGQKFDSRWLCFLMNSRVGKSQVEGVQYGTAQKQFNIVDAVDFLFPFPPIEEQTAIAKVLSDIDELVSEQKRLIVKARHIKQGMMQELLTGKTRLVKPEEIA